MYFSLIIKNLLQKNWWLASAGMLFPNIAGAHRVCPEIGHRGARKLDGETGTRGVPYAIIDWPSMHRCDLQAMHSTTPALPFPA
jgi:hypothetical protein